MEGTYFTGVHFSLGFVTAPCHHGREVSGNTEAWLRGVSLFFRAKMLGLAVGWASLAWQSCSCWLMNCCERPSFPSWEQKSRVLKMVYSGGPMHVLHLSGGLCAGEVRQPWLMENFICRC